MATRIQITRIQINASSIVGECSPEAPGEWAVKCVMRRNEDGTFTVIEVEKYSWTPTSRGERECIAAGCFGCFNCQG